MSEFNEITEKIVEFTKERDWEQFHNGKDLALALSIEAAELNEAFLWKDAENVKIEKVKEELADVFNYAFLIANKYDLIDMNFLGINFGSVPSTAFSKDGEEKASYFTLIVPVLSLVFSILQTKLSQKNSNMTDEQKEQQKKFSIKF